MVGFVSYIAGKVSASDEGLAICESDPRLKVFCIIAVGGSVSALYNPF